MRKAYALLLGIVFSAFIVSLGAAPLAAAASVSLLRYASASAINYEEIMGYLGDAGITAKVKAALLTNSTLRGTSIGVETDRGVVQLSGVVDSREQEMDAVRAAGDVDNVQSVTDLLRVKDMREGQRDRNLSLSGIKNDAE